MKAFFEYTSKRNRTLPKVTYYATSKLFKTRKPKGNGFNFHIKPNILKIKLSHPV